jgi:hypothetical protein
LSRAIQVSQLIYLLPLGAYMFRSKILWAIVLGLVTSVLILKARMNLGYSPAGTRILYALYAPGTHFVGMLNTPGALAEGWTRFWRVIAFTCNLLIYVFFWYACIWFAGYFRERQNPYDRGSTLVPPSLR